MYLLEMRLKLIFCFIIFSACSDSKDDEKEQIVVVPEIVSYQMDVQPLFDSSCTNCHGNKGKLSLTSYQNTMKGGENGSAVIQNDGAESLLVKKLNGTASGQRMPPEPKNPWDETKILLVTKWIDQGAKNN